MGRPTKFKTEYCQALVEFFSGPRTERVMKSRTTGKNEYEREDFETVPLPLPTFAKFARSIGVNRDTLDEWTRSQKEFSEAYNEAKDLQKEFLVDNGLAGLYPPASFIFTAKNITDMRDKNETDLTSGGKPLQIQWSSKSPTIPAAGPNSSTKRSSAG